MKHRVQRDTGQPPALGGRAGRLSGPAGGNEAAAAGETEWCFLEKRN